MREFLDQLPKFLTELGPVLSFLVLTALLLALYMLLKFPENTFRMLLPFIRDILERVLSEFRNDHPAIRVELALEAFLLVIVLICLGLETLHALVPWVTEGGHSLVKATGLGTLIVFFLVGGCSIRLAPRLR